MLVWEIFMLTQLHIMVHQTSQQVSKLLYNLKKLVDQVLLMFHSKEILRLLELLLLSNRDMKKHGRKSIRHLLNLFIKALEIRCLPTLELEKVYTKTTGICMTPGQNLCKFLVDQVLLMFHSKEISNKQEPSLLNNNNKKKNGKTNIKHLLNQLLTQPETRC